MFFFFFFRGFSEAVFFCMLVLVLDGTCMFSSCFFQVSAEKAQLLADECRATCNVCFGILHGLVSQPGFCNSKEATTLKPSI